MKSALLASLLLIAVLAGGSFSVNAQATGDVATVSNSQIGFIVANGIIYSVDSRGVATVLPASLRLSGTLQGINGFTQMIAVLKAGTMLTIDGKVVPAPVGLVFGSSTGTPARPVVTPAVPVVNSPSTTTVVNTNGSTTTTTTNTDGSTTTTTTNTNGSTITTIVKADGSSTTTTTGAIATAGTDSNAGINGTSGASTKSSDTSGSGAAFKSTNPAGAGAAFKTINPAGSGAAFKTINPAGSGASFKSASPNGPGNPNGVGTGVKR